MIRRPWPQGVTNPAGRISAHNKLLLQFGRSGRVVDREGSWIVGVLQALSGINKSQFSQRSPITMWGVVLSDVG